MTLVDFMAFALAVYLVVEDWETGTIFERWRQKIRAAAADVRAGNSADFPGEDPYAGAMARFVITLLDCPYCLGHWVALALALLCVVPGLVWPGWRIFLVPLYALGAAGVAFVLRDLATWLQDH